VKDERNRPTWSPYREYLEALIRKAEREVRHAEATKQPDEVKNGQ
jgi:hypothetical protein